MMFNVRGEHVPGCLGRGVGKGLSGYQPGVYVPLKALFLVSNEMSPALTKLQHDN